VTPEVVFRARVVDVVLGSDGTSGTADVRK